LNKQQLQKMRHYKYDPVYWVEDIVRATPTFQQSQFLEAYIQPGAHVSARSGHGVGKTSCLAWMLLHFLYFFPEALVPCTAPSGHQLFDVLWAEAGRWWDKLDPWWKNQLLITKSRIDYTGPGSKRFAVARTARAEKPEALAGFHSKNILFLIDEASAIHNAIFEVAEGALSTPGARVVMASNPSRGDGYFYDSHHGDAADWTRLHFSCEDSPLTTQKYRDKEARKYGVDSDVYAIRVLGNFPSKSSDVLIALDVVESCYGREVDNVVSPRIAGLDIARFGDDASALVVRQGAVIRHIEDWRNKETMWTVGHVKHLFSQKLFDKVAVDVIGMGSGVVDRLKELRIPVVEVNVAESAAAREDFHRLRDELWWRAKEFMEAKVGGVDIKNVTMEKFMDLAAELSSVRYDYRGARLRIFSKKEMKKLGMASPNIADAFNLTFTGEITGLRGGAGQRRREVQPAGGGAFLG